MSYSKLRIGLIAASVVFVLVLLFIAELVFIGVPHRVDYKYVELTSAGLSVEEMYKPPLSWYRGDEIPKSYTATIGEYTVRISDDLSNRFIPSLRVSAPLSATIEVEGISSCARSHRESNSEVLILWISCAPIGNPVQFFVRLENHPALRVRGVVRQGGRFTLWERAMP